MQHVRRRPTCRGAWLLQAAEEWRDAPDHQVRLQLLLPAGLATHGALGLVDADALERGNNAVTAMANWTMLGTT